MHIIKYNKPAKNWREALPLGNGLTGIMVYGSLKRSVYASTTARFGRVIQRTITVR